MADAFRPGCGSGWKAFFWHLSGLIWWAVLDGKSIMVEGFFRGVCFLGCFGCGTVYFLSEHMLVIFLGLWGLEGLFSREHIASIMMHPVSKICLCLWQMQTRGENLSALSCWECFSVPCGRRFQDATGLEESMYRSEASLPMLFAFEMLVRGTSFCLAQGIRWPAAAAREQGSAMRKPLPLLLASDDG